MILDKMTDEIRRELEALPIEEWRKIEVICPHLQASGPVYGTDKMVLLRVGTCELVNKLALGGKFRHGLSASWCVACKLQGPQDINNIVVRGRAHARIKDALMRLDAPSPEKKYGVTYDDCLTGLAQIAEKQDARKYLWWLYRHDVLDEKHLKKLWDGLKLDDGFSEQDEIELETYARNERIL